MSEKWDKDYNEVDLTAIQRMQIMQDEADERHAARRRENSYTDSVPALGEEELRATYPYIQSLPNDAYQLNTEYNAHPDPWYSNRIYAVCHNCGSINYKNVVRETTTCRRCRSHNVAIVRGAIIQSAVEMWIEQTNGQAVLQMDQIFAARKERMKAERRAARNDVH